MARLASQMRAGYYPTPPEVIPLITSHIQPAGHKGIRILDPCTGEGQFLHDTAVALTLLPFGVELNPDRAQAATLLLNSLKQKRPELVSQQYHHLLESDYRLIRCPNDAFGLTIVNPPYDQDYEDRRLEYQWLKQVRVWLQPNGILVYIIPQYVLGIKAVAEYVASWFTDVQVYRFPDEVYPRFKQIILFGRRLPRRQILQPEVVAGYRQIAEMGWQLTALATAATPTYVLPKPILPPKQFYFRKQFIDPDEALAEAAQLGVRTLPEWRANLVPAAEIDVPVRPVMPLKIGHMAGVIAAGLLNNQVLANGRERYLLKGRAFKEEVVEEDVQEKSGGVQEKTTTTTERIVTDITTIDEQGEIVSRTGDDLASFMSEWMPVLTQNVAAHYPPRYLFNYDELSQAGLLNRLSLTRIIPNLGYGGLLPAQKHVAAALIEQLRAFDDALLVGECGTGKAQPLSSNVLTPIGWKRMGDIRIGDEVINPEGGSARVIGVFAQGEKDIYRVTFRDGAQTECCGDHLWQVLTPERKQRAHFPQVFSLNEIKDRMFAQSGHIRYFIPLVKPVEFEEKDLPLDPYLVGALIGDGGLSDGYNVKISTAEEGILERIRRALPNGLSLKHIRQYDYRITGDYSENNRSHPRSNPVLNALRQLDLMGCRSETKFIPKPYLFASVKSRVALLQGLLDTDGTVKVSQSKLGKYSSTISFSTVSRQLTTDTVDLVQSFGGTAKVKTRIPHYFYSGEYREGQRVYLIYIKLPEAIQPFHLTRKLNRLIPRTRYGITRAMIKVEYVGRKQAQCVALDSKNQLYVTDDYIVTHNTTIGTAVAAGLNVQRTLILCPPHLVPKWKREVKIVWPECQPFVLKTVNDVQGWFKRPTDLPQVGILSTSRAKLGSGWEHAYAAWLPVEKTWEKHAPHLDAETRSRLTKKALSRHYVRCPQCRAVQTDSEMNILSPGQFEQSRKKQFCVACNTPLHQFQRQLADNQKRRSGYAEYVRREQLFRQTMTSSWTKTSLQTHPFPEPDGYARWPLADVIFRHYKGQIDLAIFDEIHELKGESTDQGFAYAQLVCAARKSLGMTGTIFGGKASSLFHLLYRLAPDMRRAFTDKDEDGRQRLRLKSWLEQYGVLQEIVTAEVDESGKLTGNGRSKSYTKELPGINPAMLPWLLNRAVFLSLMDMGFALPDYEEIPITVSMTDEQAEQYESLRIQLKEALKQRRQEGDNRLLGAYLAALLYWPDSPWRPERVVDPSSKWKLKRGVELDEVETVAYVPGLSEHLIFPKEQAVIDLVRNEKTRGRRCVLYCQQTGIRDITPRWLDLFARHKIRVAVLKASPDKREEWVEKQVAVGIDVIITHPKKVQTGLDLLDFPTLIWMGQEFSVYTVLQASRRSWRIGQTQPVKVYFFQYRHTLQESAMRLIAGKVAAAIRVNGDTVEGGSIANLDENGRDMMALLADIAIHGERVVTDLQDAFAQANQEMRQANRFVGNYAFTAGATPVHSTTGQRPRPARPSILMG